MNSNDHPLVAKHIKALADQLEAEADFMSQPWPQHLWPQQSDAVILTGAPSHFVPAEAQVRYDIARHLRTIAVDVLRPAPPPEPPPADGWQYVPLVGPPRGWNTP
jgi:hypothetical protein